LNLNVGGCLTRIWTEITELSIYGGSPKRGEPARQNQGPKSLVLPRTHGYGRVFAALWWAHASIFNAWSCLVFWNFLLPINRPAETRNKSRSRNRL